MAISKSRIAELDLLRFLAALAVVLYHYGRASDVGPALARVTEFGFLGVQLFFMISGFVILWTAMQKDAREFVAARVSRLYPTFWVCVLLTATTLHIIGEKVSAPGLLANLTMIPGPLRYPTLDGVYWTLVVEIKFYALILCLLLAHQLTHIRRWLEGWLCVSVLAAIYPHYLHFLALDQFSVYFIGGCYLYLIRTQRPCASLLLPLIVCAALSVTNAVRIESSYTTDDSLRAHVWVVSIVIIEYLAFLAIALRRWSLPSLPVWGWLGAMTYPLYLVHVGTVDNLGLHYLAPGPGRVALMMVASLCLAGILAASIERRGCVALHRWILKAV
jgi:peptidoglycan/LPS O-acetylase OafA/YrhL